MKFQYLGTAAAEGWPAMFCACDNCRRAALAGGRNLRTRSQAVIDDRLLIDFPADTCVHVMQHGLLLSAIHSCILTHNHSDHLYAADLEMRREGFAVLADPRPLTLFGTAPAGRDIRQMTERYGLADQDRVDFQEIRAFETFETEGYTITALDADHDPASGPVIYLISDGTKTILYANDTGWFPQSTWDWLKEHRPHLDFVSLDCTGGILHGWRSGHMGLDTDIDIMAELRGLGLADGATTACVHHFSHNGGAIYDELVPLAAERGFLVSYDGMALQI